jgi:hypothetical protein
MLVNILRASVSNITQIVTKSHYLLDITLLTTKELATSGDA